MKACTPTLSCARTTPLCLFLDHAPIGKWAGGLTWMEIALAADVLGSGSDGYRYQVLTPGLEDWAAHFPHRRFGTP